MKIWATLFLIWLPVVSSFGQQAASANYTCSENSIRLNFSASNDGKFRFKTRDENVGFGKTFATRKNAFSEKVFLEWQIGYDALVQDVESGKKTTSLNRTKFVGSTGKEKYLYELSEILYQTVKCGLVSTAEIDKLANEIDSYAQFIDEKPIIVEKPVKLLMNGVDFAETNVKMPTLFMPQNSDGTLIEISIQKQQYAAGVQPMIYFCIPFKSFVNWKDLDGKKSVRGSNLQYVLKKDNVEVVFNLFRVFGMASSRHKFDVRQILKTIKQLV